MKAVIKIAVFLLAVFQFTSAHASLYTITGDDSLPGIVGEYSKTSLFSWMSHRFPEATTRQSWTLGAGTDGGIIPDQAQDVGDMMGIRPMFNQPTTFFSVASGITQDNSYTFDLTSLRMWQSNNVIDIGAGFDTLVPLVSDISLLSAGQNGWMLNGDGTYHLLYNAGGICDGCDLTVHLYGTVVPAPAAILLFLSGIAVVAGAGLRRRSAG